MAGTAASPKTTNTAASTARKENARAECHIITENDVGQDTEQNQVATGSQHGKARNCTRA